MLLYNLVDYILRFVMSQTRKVISDIRYVISSCIVRFPSIHRVMRSKLVRKGRALELGEAGQRARIQNSTHK